MLPTYERILSMFSTMSPNVRCRLLEGNDAIPIDLSLQACRGGWFFNHVDMTFQNLTEPRLERIQPTQMGESPLPF